MAPASTSAATAYQVSYELEAAGKTAAAVKVLKAIAGDQQHSYFHQLRLGWLYYLGRNYKQAITCYDRAASLKPRAVEPRLGMMLPQMALRRWKDAETVARKVLRMEPKNSLARSRLAWILFNLGRYAEAERVYQAVLTSYPANIQMQAGLGWSMLKQGKTARAVKVFETVLHISPRNQSAANGLQVAGRR
jgi:tetratricopeptide (TPR) repeat protein